MPGPAKISLVQRIRTHPWFFAVAALVLVLLAVRLLGGRPEPIKAVKKVTGNVLPELGINTGVRSAEWKTGQELLGDLAERDKQREAEIKALTQSIKTDAQARAQERNEEKQAKAELLGQLKALMEKQQQAKPVKSAPRP